MEKHKCKFCSRVFGNGRALGGHVRSHMVNLHTERRKFSSDFRQSKRTRKSRISADNFPEEDVAYCLIMLSQDKWIREEKKKKKNEKVFRSYQALGGHMANHKKIKNESSTMEEEENGGEENGNSESVGGNEKIHFADSVSASASVQGISRTGATFIDLNLPAPMEVVDDDILTFSS